MEPLAPPEAAVLPLVDSPRAELGGDEGLDPLRRDLDVRDDSQAVGVAGSELVLARARRPLRPADLLAVPFVAQRVELLDVATEIADGRDPVCDQQPRKNVAGQRQVRVQIPESRDQVQPRRVDRTRASRDRLVRIEDPSDSIAFDHDRHRVRSGGALRTRIPQRDPGQDQCRSRRRFDLHRTRMTREQAG